MFDRAGNLFGAAAIGGGSANNGAIFELSPPVVAGGDWSETLIHKFDQAGDGIYPVGGLLLEKASGVLIGTATNGGTYSGGVVFALAPPAPGLQAWTERILYSFGSDPATGIDPSNPVVEDRAGNLYSATTQLAVGFNGAVYELIRPRVGGAPWRCVVLANASTGIGDAFDSGLTIDALGNVYGVSAESLVAQSAHGTVFEFTAPVTPFHPTILTPVLDGNFSRSGLVRGKHGGFFGTTQFSGRRQTKGSVFEILPPLPGQTSWRFASLYHFGLAPDGARPVGTLLFDHGVRGTLYGVTARGGTNEHGTVYTIQ